ncbi:MAG: transposase [Aquabacterium sp.]|uniref:transposase n=1 Tax=Aquabacterium sp. TaxID=1872578 RepID=UPI002715971D|nr:transposase [Aquabacterium sp.]MDO9005516.1 transposase [Aquabacterium sp.]
MSILFKLITTIQQTLFPALETELDAPLGEKGELFVSVVELVRPERFTAHFEWAGVGCPRQWRLPILLAFIAKAVWNFPTTRALLDRLAHDPTLRRLCGWERAGEVPSEATFSRAFAEFAKSQLPQQLHEALIKDKLGDKLVGHLSTDATAIAAREKPAAKPKPAPKAKAKRGRPTKGEERPAPDPKRLELQGGRTLAENLAELPCQCDSGAKKNAQGINQYWRGYKGHLITADGGIPVGFVLSSASLHDSQVAIPLLQMAAGRVTSLYDLMDSAYYAEPIMGYSRRLGHVPVIEPKATRGAPAAQLEPARRLRYRERSTAERANSDLKDNHGGATVRVRGGLKVAAHLMLGVLVVAAKSLVGLLE